MEMMCGTTPGVPNTIRGGVMRDSLFNVTLYMDSKSKPVCLLMRAAQFFQNGGFMDNLPTLLLSSCTVEGGRWLLNVLIHPAHSILSDTVRK